LPLPRMGPNACRGVASRSVTRRTSMRCPRRARYRWLTLRFRVRVPVRHHPRLRFCYRRPPHPQCLFHTDSHRCPRCPFRCPILLSRMVLVACSPLPWLRLTPPSRLRDRPRLPVFLGRPTCPVWMLSRHRLFALRTGLAMATIRSRWTLVTAVEAVTVSTKTGVTWMLCLVRPRSLHFLVLPLRRRPLRYERPCLLFLSHLRDQDRRHRLCHRRHGRHRRRRHRRRYHLCRGPLTMLLHAHSSVQAATVAHPLRFSHPPLCARYLRCRRLCPHPLPR